MKQTKRTTRRSFLKKGAAAAGAAFVAGVPGCAAPGGRRAPMLAPHRDKLRLAFIGTGGIGGYHLDETKDLGIVCPCYCDVDTKRMGKAAELYPDAKPYQDYRKLFEAEAGNFDAVMIGIPDHHHFPATVLAMQHGKHVYTQKPLTHTPWEARQLMEAVRKYHVATQMGNQGHAGEGWRLVYEWIHSGAVGEIYETHTWTDRPIWPQGMGRPEGEDAVPENLNWDCWLGPAPTRPYKGGPAPDKAGPYHWFNWRGWIDFGCGALGDMACHTMDGIFWALNPGYPTSVEPVTAAQITNEAFPNASTIKWEFPRRGWRRGFAAYWYDGGLKPPLFPEIEKSRTSYKISGNLFRGTKGSLLVYGDYGSSPIILPEEYGTKVRESVGKKPPQLLERSPGHVKEWVMAAKGEKPIDFPKSNFRYSAPMSETILLGNIALRVGRRLEWDGRNLRFTNVPEANELVSKEYREGWRFEI